jgi:tetratricopeptide (TPR) repeat protein
MSRRKVTLLLATTAVASLIVVYVGFAARGDSPELREARREIEEKRYGAALLRLKKLDLDDPEVNFRIGLCEQALNHPEKALAAWERVASDPSFATPAAVARATLLINRRRFRPAEDLLEATVRKDDGLAPRRALDRLYRLESRIDDLRNLNQKGWRISKDSVADLKKLWNLDASPWPIDGLKTVLAAPSDDDRVWLARANLALLTGQFGEASHWLDECLKRVPEDPVVWRSRLELGHQTDQPSIVREALTHLAPDSLSDAEVLSLRAWLLSLRGDRDAELKALEDWLEVDPRNTRTMERLATLSLEAGDRARAVELRAEKAELDAKTEQYRAGFASPEADRHAAEMSELAEAIGRPFDARCWAEMELLQNPRNIEVRRRLSKLPKPSPDRAKTRSLVADLLRELNASTPAASSSTVRTKPDFTEDAETVGLRFFEDNGATSSFYLPEIMAGGVGLLDYDGDGFLDVYAVQGGPFPAGEGVQSPGDRLFRNRGDGAFEDVTEASGISRMPRGYGHGVAVGDFDNDGYPDLFITRWHAYALYHNNGNGTFEDWTEKAGFGGDRDWPTSAAWADLDNDGDLDLYVCHYLTFDPKTAPPCVDNGTANKRIYCNPLLFAALSDHMFRNDGGRFVDMTSEAGIVDTNGRGLGVLAADLDGDGKVDLFVANDMTANAFYRNLGGMKFEEVGHEAGVASNAEGGYHAGMGIAWGDVDGDAKLDLAVTNGYNESTRIYQNLGGGMFADQTSTFGVTAPTRYLVGFGVAFLDYDDDGRLDLISANGNLNDGRPYQPFPLPVHLMAGGPNGRMADVSTDAGPPWSIPRMGRGLSVGDLDNDGKTDAVVVSENEPISYFHNRTRSGNSITLRLLGQKSNRDAVGAKVIVQSGNRRQVAERFGGGSYQSSSDLRLHFGLGDDAQVDSIEVHWPSGQMDRFGRLEAGTGYLLREGTTSPEPLPGFRR